LRKIHAGRNRVWGWCQALTTSDERVGCLLFLRQTVGGTLFGWEERKIGGQ
jgi:hypothetical protein